MANRSYLYSLNNRPTSHADRPETISGISEFAYFVPFSYRVLMSGDPQACSSLIFDGFEGEPPDKKTKLYAISGDFDIGFNRLKKFFSVLRHLASGKYLDLLTYIDESVEFLAKHRDQYLLLDAFELDIMTPSSVENEISECVRAGVAVDSLPNNLTEAASRLKEASQEKLASPLDAFYGLRLDDDCDSIRNNMTEYPIGLYFSESLHLIPQNRAESIEEANQIFDK